jgi:hypothetical protein
MGAGDEVVDLDAIMHDLRADAADPLARIRHGTYIADGLALVAEVERLRAVATAAVDELTRLRVEVERLRAENGRLASEREDLLTEDEAYWRYYMIPRY